MMNLNQLKETVQNAMENTQGLLGAKITQRELLSPAMAKALAHKTNPAAWTYECLARNIQDFEEDLDQDHEIGARLVSFGQVVTFHIEDMGYYGPEIITFEGTTGDLQKVRLVQHYSQLNVLLTKMQKLGDKPNRIGFMLTERIQTEASSEPPRGEEETE